MVYDALIKKNVDVRKWTGRELVSSFRNWHTDTLKQYLNNYKKHKLRV